MLTILFALQAATAAPVSSAETPRHHRHLVPGWRRPTGLKDCRRCATARRIEEIKAAIAHAENQFIAGKYEGAQGTLYATINSTRGAEKRFPVAVGDLRRAEARVSTHLGETDYVRTGMVASRDALRRSGRGRSAHPGAAAADRRRDHDRGPACRPSSAAISDTGITARLRSAPTRRWRRTHSASGFRTFTGARCSAASVCTRGSRQSIVQPTGAHFRRR